MEHYHTGQSSALLPIGIDKGEVALVVSLVARHANVHSNLIFHGSRCRIKTARARQLAMYLAHVVLGESLTAVGQAFGRDRTTVSYACGLIEDMRDDVRFDTEVSDLERQLQALVGADHV
ncbi:helix-turn-helix domain-containing protein [Devosia sp. XK-2]|uniref:helix-turn-helix domain-containing protein n=1 Tax=Devosia sp. XK-2 TaxID=3126689 RepID=UPI0030D5EFA6